MRPACRQPLLAQPGTGRSACESSRGRRCASSSPWMPPLGTVLGSCCAPASRPSVPAERSCAGDRSATHPPVFVIAAIAECARQTLPAVPSWHPWRGTSKRVLPAGNADTLLVEQVSSLEASALVTDRRSFGAAVALAPRAVWAVRLLAFRARVAAEAAVEAAVRTVQPELWPFVPLSTLGGVEVRRVPEVVLSEDREDPVTVAVGT